jgi:glycosyltransferase involved in cell wall biosynthesis
MDQGQAVRAAPAVTVGVPVYNSGKYLAETLRSILAQTYTDFELLISDNASTDHSAEICRDFARGDARVRYVRQEHNIGAPRNYNLLVTLARGRYLKWSSSNDLIEPEFLASCVPVLEQRADVVLVYARTRYFDTASGSMRDYADDLDLQSNDPVERYRQCDRRLNAAANNIMNGVIRLSALSASTLHGDYPSSDLALMSELALHGKFVEVPRALFYRRTEPAARFGAGTPGLHRLYYPHDTSGTARRYWRRLGQMLRGVTRAPLTEAQRVRLYAYIARRAWWNRRDLLPLRGESRVSRGQ